MTGGRRRAGLVASVGAAALCSALWVTWRATPLTDDSKQAAVSPSVAPTVVVEYEKAMPLEGHPAIAPVALEGHAPRANDDAGSLDELRSLVRSDPERASERARADLRAFPNSPNAAERASILVHALAAAGRASEARGEAEAMVNRYPDSAWVREVERFTGAHRHRNLRLDSEGRVVAE